MRSQLLHDPSPPAHSALSFSTIHHVSMLARGPSFDGLLAPSAPCPPTPSASAAAHKIRRRENSLSCFYSQHSLALGQTLAATPLQRPPPPPPLRPSLGHAVRRGEVSLHVPFPPSSSSRALIWFRDGVVERVRCCGSDWRRRTVALRAHASSAS